MSEWFAFFVVVLEEFIAFLSASQIFGVSLAAFLIAVFVISVLVRAVLIKG